MRIRWYRQAIVDLTQLRRYIADDNPEAAKRVAQRIQESVKQLADQPGIGRAGRIPGTRERVVSGTSYIVPYRVTGGAIEILRVLHTARRWPEQGN